MAAFDYRQASEIRDAFRGHEIRYLFIGKSGAILLGFPDTTQDADLFVEKTALNGDRLVKALHDLGFRLTDEQAEEVRRGKAFIQLKNGPFDLDLVFAPDGIERRGMGKSGAGVRRSGVKSGWLEDADAVCFVIGGGAIGFVRENCVGRGAAGGDT
jgi:hypothetical protein